MRTAAWLSLGGAVALFTGASVAVLVHNSNTAIYNDDARCFHGGFTRDQLCSSYRDAASTAQTVAIVEFQAGVLAVGASIVLFTLAPKARPVQVGALRCTMGMGVSCGASF